MPCETIRFGNGSTAIVCSRGRRSGGARSTCFYCKKETAKLCDYPVGKPLKKPVKRDDGSLRRFPDCNRPLCDDHAKKIVETSDYDFCMHHIDAARAAYERKKENLLSSVKTEKIKESGEKENAE